MLTFSLQLGASMMALPCRRVHRQHSNRLHSNHVTGPRHPHQWPRRGMTARLAYYAGSAPHSAARQGQQDTYSGFG